MIAEMRQRFGVPVVVRYTSTEASLGTGTTLDSSDEEVATTVGRPVPGVELAIVDDEGAALPDGDVGRVLLRSDAVMRGYWGQGPGAGRTVAELIDAEATATVLAADGWLTTGDFGVRLESGNLQLAGRAHERYIRGGYNIYPAEVEKVLATHPSVARVAVTGVADDVLGEVGVAVVVAAAGAAAGTGRAAVLLRPLALGLQGARRPGRGGRAPLDPHDEGRSGGPGRPGRAGGGRTARRPGPDSRPGLPGARQ